MKIAWMNKLVQAIYTRRGARLYCHQEQMEVTLLISLATSIPLPRVSIMISNLDKLLLPFFLLKIKLIKLIFKMIFLFEMVLN